MFKLFIKTLLLSLTAIVSISLPANSGTIKLITDAPAGTKLRIQTMPYDAAVSGADKGTYNTEFYSKGEGTEITISASDLSQVEVYGCQLSSLNTSGCDKLIILRCYNNRLTTLELNECHALAVLDARENELSELNLSLCPNLEKVNVAHNSLTSLTMGSQPLLTELDCSYNTSLSKLALNDCPALTDLIFNDCKLSSLDLKSNTKLNWVMAYNNSIHGIFMERFIDNMPDIPSIGRIYIVDTRAESESNVCTMDNVRAFAAKNWLTMDYLGAGGSETELGKFYPGSDYVPTISDKTITLTTNRKAGEKISLNISSSANISISGVDEIGSTGKMTYTLNSSTVVISGDVSSFECQDNDITALSFSDPSLLTYLNCKNNKISKLNLTDANRLTQLYCENNNLISLSLDNCTSLLRVNCYQNQIKGNQMKALMNSLYVASNEPYLFIIDTKAANEGNVATTNDVAIATSKGWEVFDFLGEANWGMGVRYDGSEPTPETQNYFTISREELDHIIINVIFDEADYTPTIEGATISGWEGGQLMLKMTEKTAKIYGNAVSISAPFQAINAIDITNLPDLKDLNISLSDVKVLDLSGSRNLETLSCEGNFIENLDFSKCPMINYVNCYGNQIKGTAMTEMINSLPQRTAEEYGILIVRDTSYDPEGNVCLKSDVNIARSKYWATYELIDMEMSLYDGEDPAGISDAIGDTIAIVYDETSSTIRLNEPSDIEVFSTGGLCIAKASNSTELSIANFSKGIYLVRVGAHIIKVAK